MSKKIVEIKRSKYGDLYGLLNGRFRFQSSSNTLDLRKVRGNVSIKLESHYGVINLKLPDSSFSTTQLSGWWDIGNVYYPYFPKFKHNLVSFGGFVRKHWYKGLVIGKLGWDIFKELGILAIPLNKFIK